MKISTKRLVYSRRFEFSFATCTCLFLQFQYFLPVRMCFQFSSDAAKQLLNFHLYLLAIPKSLINSRVRPVDAPGAQLWQRRQIISWTRPWFTFERLRKGIYSPLHPFLSLSRFTQKRKKDTRL